jgi:hypothetical protein
VESEDVVLPLTRGERDCRSQEKKVSMVLAKGLANFFCSQILSILSFVSHIVLMEIPHSSLKEA